MFNKLGILVQVLINQSTKFCGEIQKLCEKTFVDQHTTSWNHFETNRLVEQMVQMMKQGLCKYGP
jgi:hypothetical protein